MGAETELRLAIRVTNPQALQSLDKLHQQLGTSGADAFDRVRKSAHAAGDEVERLGQFGKFSVQVLQAFLLYKGFVFLKTQAEQFTRELVNMEHQIALTQTQLNSFGQDFRGSLSKDVLTVAHETGVAMSELAEIQYQTVSANIAVGDSFRVMELTAKAAISGGLKDASLAFDAALTQINAFELSVQDLSLVLDKQFNLIKRGIFSYEQYARVSGEISIAFASIGQDINVANAALATISQIFTGPQLREGATGLKNAALALVENADAFEDFGIALHDGEGNFRNFIDIVNDLDVALKGLTPQEREQALLGMFDEKRARRGIQVLLRELDSLNQFYVEQQFALGELDDAFETMNDSLKTQAGILKNELIPAFEPFVALAEDALRVVNGLSVAVGGTQNLAVLAMGVTGGAFLGAAARYQGISPTANRNLSIPNVALPGAMFGSSTAYQMALPSMATVGVGALGGALAFEQGRGHGGVDLAQALTTVGGAAVGGAFFGGPVGAATFGGLAAAGLFLGEAFEKEAPQIAKSFADAFREALIEESKSVADAFTTAFQKQDQGLGRFFDPKVLSGFVVSEMTPQDVARVSGFGRNPGDSVRTSRGPNGEIVYGAVPFPSPSISNARSVPGLGQLIEAGAVSKIAQMGAEAERLARGVANIPGAPDPADARRIALEAGITRFMPSDLAEDHARSLKTLVNAMVEYNLTLEEQRKAFAILKGEGFTASDIRSGRADDPAFRLRRFSDFLASTRSGEAPSIDSFGMFKVKIDSLITGSLDPLISVFDELGASGEEASAAWREVADTMHRFERLQKLLELQWTQTTVSTVWTKKPGAWGGLGSWTSEQVTTTIQKDFLDIVNEQFGDAPITREEIAREFYDALKEDIAVAAGKSFPELTREDFLKFMTGDLEQEVIEPLVIPSMTSLAEGVERARQGIEEGFLTTTLFTVEELRDLGTSLESFNRQVFKVGVVEELQRLAEVAGYGKDRFQTTIEQLVRNIQLGGMTFQEVMGDPVRLAELLAELEFGDVNIDQSTQNNFTIRIETATGTENAVDLADAIMRELNNRTRQAVSR